VKRRLNDMDKVRRQIDRDGEYRPAHCVEAFGASRCTNCNNPSTRLKGGLCPYCQHAFGVKGATERRRS
jgi:hypothetical protein